MVCSFVMGPHPNDFDGFRLFNDLVNESVLDVAGVVGEFWLGKRGGLLPFPWLSLATDDVIGGIGWGCAKVVAPSTRCGDEVRCHGQRSRPCHELRDTPRTDQCQVFPFATVANGHLFYH